ncbi:MAG: signal peptidase II [Nanoarchaeales archaeon]|nr:signal peptidase II [Nanoarchaeales archaeon]
MKNQTNEIISNNLFIKNTFIFSFILLLIDIITKYIFTNKFFFENSLIYIQYSENRGSAFSMFSNFDYYNYLIVILSLFVLYYLYKNITEFNINKITRFSYYLLIAGIIGNLFDRIIFGYVKDFIGLKYLFIFNIADAYLTFAVLMFIYVELRNSSFLSDK